MPRGTSGRGLPGGRGYTLSLPGRNAVARRDPSSGGPMTEILTESFCERCGTRYTFESSAPRRSRVRRAKVFSKGVRNFVLTDDSSFSEAMADARSEEELSATAHQLDAFHQTFNFCLGCRQYTCGSCWNTAEGRCLTCAPDARLEAAAAAHRRGRRGRGGARRRGHPGRRLAGEGRLGRAPCPGRRRTGSDRRGRGRSRSARQRGRAGCRGRRDGRGPARCRGRCDGRRRDREPAVLPASKPSRRPGSRLRRIEPGTAGVAPVQGLVPGQSLEEAIAAWEAQQVATEIALEAATEPEPVAAEAEPEAGGRGRGRAGAGARGRAEAEAGAGARGRGGRAGAEPVAAAEPEPEPVAAAAEPEPAAAGRRAGACSSCRRCRHAAHLARRRHPRAGPRACLPGRSDPGRAGSLAHRGPR